MVAMSIEYRTSTNIWTSGVRVTPELANLPHDAIVQVETEDGFLMEFGFEESDDMTLLRLTEIVPEVWSQKELAVRNLLVEDAKIVDHQPFTVVSNLGAQSFRAMSIKMNIEKLSN